MISRRRFIKKSSLTAFLAMMGGESLLAGLNKWNTIAWSFSDNPSQLFSKHSEMVVLNDRPWNMEAQAHLLNDAVTPADRFFIRNNGLIPDVSDVANWRLEIEGESVMQSKTYSIEDLKGKFSHHTYQLILECGGNGRSEFNPPAKGNQWTIGAVGCSVWTGVRLKDVLEDVGIKEGAVYVGYYGADKHLSGDPEKVVISRGIPMEKAMMEETLIAFEMNGQPIPLVHGYPLRLVAGGWPASASGKWLRKLVVRNIVHDGPKMGGQSYRVPCEPVASGSQIDDDRMCIIESMPVKSLITVPKTGAVIPMGNILQVAGHAWAGELDVAQVQWSIDFGATWSSCILDKPVNRLAWQQWRADIGFPKKGYYEFWAKATDTQGQSQPMVVPGWNPKGYLNNACHRIAVKVV